MKRYPKSKAPDPTYPVDETLKFEISYSLKCQSGNKMFIEMAMTKLKSAFKMKLNCGDAQLKFISMRGENE